MMSSWASCGVGASKGTRGGDADAVPEISSGSRSLYPVMGVVCQPEKWSNSRGSGRRKRTKFPGASCGEQSKLHPSVSAKQGRALHCFVSLEMMYIHTE